MEFLVTSFILKFFNSLITFESNYYNDVSFLDIPNFSPFHLIDKSRCSLTTSILSFIDGGPVESHLYKRILFH